MNSKINLQARIKRHSKVIKENLKDVHPFISMYRNLNYIIVLSIVIFAFPIYPVFSTMIHKNTVYEFYRGNIEEDSIIGYYSEEEEEAKMISKEDYISINTLLDENRDTTGINQIIEYEVKNGDSYNSIGDNFNITKDDIIWANNFKSNKVLQPGEKIKLPPVSGVIHNVDKGETLESLAKKYNIDKEKIIEQNSLEDNSKIKEGLVLIIPGAKKYTPPPIKQNYYTPEGGYKFVSNVGNEYMGNYEGQYNLTWRKPQHTFYYGNCTYFVAQYKNVDWGGNAKDWLKNAKAKGHSTGTTPTIGSIVVFHGRGYNPKYGHVAIVIDIKGNDLIVKDMNYRKFNEVTVRKVPKNQVAISGYIYVD